MTNANHSSVEQKYLATAMASFVQIGGSDHALGTRLKDARH